jgi:uncharacterized protein YqeY
MGLRDRFSEQMKEAMKAKETRRLSTVRMIMAAVKDRDIAARSEESREGISDDDILGLLGKMIKQREESAGTYDTGSRPELAAGERAEIEIIREFMPRQMSDEETRKAVEDVIKELGASSLKDMGKVMGGLKTRYSGQMDFGKAGAAVKVILSAAN